MLKTNSVTVLSWMKNHDGENFTAADIAEATGLNVRSVNGVLTAALARHKNTDGEIVPLVERVPAELTLADETKKAIKLVRLTDAGREFDIEADQAEAEATDAE